MGYRLRRDSRGYGTQEKRFRYLFSNAKLSQESVFWMPGREFLGTRKGGWESEGPCGKQTLCSHDSTVGKRMYTPNCRKAKNLIPVYADKMQAGACEVERAEDYS